MLETVARKRRQKGGFLLRLLGRALEHFHGDFPSAHKRYGTSRASHKRDAVLADDHLRLLYAHRSPLRGRELTWDTAAIPFRQLSIAVGDMRGLRGRSPFWFSG